MRTRNVQTDELVDQQQGQWQGLRHCELYGLYGYPMPATKKAFSHYYETQKLYKFKAKMRARKLWRAILEAGDI